MRLVLAAIALCLAACTSTPAPDDPNAVHIVLRPDASGLHAAYTLPAPASTFSFDGDAGDIRTDTWTTETPGVRLAANSIDLAAPASTFAITLAPDSQQRDRIYPALTRVGSGWLIYAPHLAPATASGLAFDITFDLPAGWTIIGHRDAQGQLTRDGWVYAGPAQDVERGAADVATAPATPAWLRAEILAAANDAAALYEQRLGVKLTSKPGIIISYFPDDSGSGMRGDVTQGAMVSVRFYGAGHATRDDAAARQIREFLAHEIFHFWNGDLVNSAENAERPWLHEGGASYAAILALNPSPEPTSPALLASLNDNLIQCQSTLQGDESLMTGKLRSGRAPYVCGVVLQWAWDAGLRFTSSGKQDVLSLWKELIAYALAHDGTYRIDHTSTFIPEAHLAANILLDHTGPTRWDDFATAMRRYGADFAAGRNAEADRNGALLHILAQRCNGQYGFTNNNGYITLETGNRCGSLNGDGQVDAIAGHNLFTDASVMYDRVREICATGGTLDFTRNGAPVASAPCTQPLPPARVFFTATRAFTPG